MCHGTYILSYTCGHVITTPDTCLRSIDPHYRCEPFGMKITKPVGRCVECFARDLEPVGGLGLGLATSVRFNPFPIPCDERGGGGGEGGGDRRDVKGSGQVRAILRWSILPSFSRSHMHGADHRNRVGNVKSLRSLGSRSLGELRGDSWCGRMLERSSTSSDDDGSGILVRRSIELDSVRLPGGIGRTTAETLGLEWESPR